jgi:hypothetical protein
MCAPRPSNRRTRRDAGVGIEPRRLRSHQHDRLVDPATGSSADVEAAFGSCDEEPRTRREPMKTSKIDMASVHHVERAGLDWQMIGHRHIVGFAVGHPHERGDVAAQIQERVQLHRPFAATEPRPGEQAETEVDRGPVEGVDGLLQLRDECGASRWFGHRRRAGAENGPTSTRERTALQPDFDFPLLAGSRSDCAIRLPLVILNLNERSGRIVVSVRAFGRSNDLVVADRGDSDSSSGPDGNDP